jgi:hypothetical protein
MSSIIPKPGPSKPVRFCVRRRLGYRWGSPEASKNSLCHVMGRFHCEAFTQKLGPALSQVIAHKRPSQRYGRAECIRKDLHRYPVNRGDSEGAH